MSIASLLILSLAVQEFSSAPGHWPQWHGPKRDNVSTETGLLKEWPEGGPPLLWKAEGLGAGIGGPSVAGGMLFILGSRDEEEVLFALDGRGRHVWEKPLGSASRGHWGMRYVTQRLPTVDDRLIYLVTWEGTLFCMRSVDGKTVWKVDYRQTFGVRRPGWGVGDQPLVEGRLLICAPGGGSGTVVGLDKRTGKPVWKSSGLSDRMPHAALVPAEFGGIRQIVVFSYEHVAGVYVRNGKVLWRVPRKGRTAVVCTPVVGDGTVFVTSSFGVGCNAFGVAREGGLFKVSPLYSGNQLTSQRGGIVAVGGHVFGSDLRTLRCIELETGELKWEDRSVGRSSVTYADGHLIVRGESRGASVALVEATTAGYVEKGRFHPTPEPDIPEWKFSHPVVAGGRLYLRDQDLLLCYDLRGPDYVEPEPVWNLLPGALDALPDPSPRKPRSERRPGDPDAIFVATPRDVVERMLTLAEVGKDDVVFDLGSGDGRIVVTAAKRHGCRAVGFEIDAELVEQSRKKVEEAGVGDKVTIKAEDLFDADLSGATVITLYLGEENNRRLLPKLRKLPAGTRIVTHEHGLGDPTLKPDQSIKLVSTADGLDHTIHLWKAPLKGAEK